jgi:hypothetical protein
LSAAFLAFCSSLVVLLSGELTSIFAFCSSLIVLFFER